MASVPVVTRDGVEVMKIRVAASGKDVALIFEALKQKGLTGTLEVDGVTLTAGDLVIPGDTLTFVPLKRRSDEVSALPFYTSPVVLRRSKKQKVEQFESRHRCVSLPELLGTQKLEVLAALNWLWLHLSDDSSINLTTFLGTTDEKRYYPYVMAVMKAAAASEQDRVEILGEDNNPDLQIIIDGNGKEVIPVDVKKVWGHGSVDDPDGIKRNAEDLDQFLDQVLKYNAKRAGDYTCLTLVIIRLSYLFFLRFNIRKSSEDEHGSLELLEYAPEFPRQGGSTSTAKSSSAGQREVRLVDIERLINETFLLEKKWSEESVETMGLSDPLVARIKEMEFREVLPAEPPEGFESLIKYFRKVAPGCYSPLRFVYESELVPREVQVAEVLASGPKSCVLATAGCTSVLKVSSKDYIELDFEGHRLVDPCGGNFLRKMVGYGRVEGAAPGLMFVELEGLGVPWSRKHVWNAERVDECWRQASLAVKAMHEQQVFHRDIKPNNFIVLDQGTESQRLVLNDLDCAVHRDKDTTSDVGTPMFKSPLLVEGGKYCCRDDWLSLGLSFAFLIGIFSESSNTNRQGKIEVLKTLADHTFIPQDMKDVITVALDSQHVCCSDGCS